MTRERDDDGEAVPMPTVFTDAADAEAAADLAEAERAAARHGATPEQAARLARISDVRRTEDRVTGWRDATHPPT